MKNIFVFDEDAPDIYQLVYQAAKNLDEETLRQLQTSGYRLDQWQRGCYAHPAIYQLAFEGENDAVELLKRFGCDPGFAEFGYRRANPEKNNTIAFNDSILHIRVHAMLGNQNFLHFRFKDMRLNEQRMQCAFGYALAADESSLDFILNESNDYNIIGHRAMGYAFRGDTNKIKEKIPKAIIKSKIAWIITGLAAANAVNKLSELSEIIKIDTNHYKKELFLGYCQGGWIHQANQLNLTYNQFNYFAVSNHSDLTSPISEFFYSNNMDIICQIVRHPEISIRYRSPFREAFTSIYHDLNHWQLLRILCQDHSIYSFILMTTLYRQFEDKQLDLILQNNKKIIKLMTLYSLKYNQVLAFVKNPLLRVLFFDYPTKFTGLDKNIWIKIAKHLLTTFMTDQELLNLYENSERIKIFLKKRHFMAKNKYIQQLPFCFGYGKQKLISRANSLTGLTLALCHHRYGVFNQKNLLPNTMRAAMNDNIQFQNILALKLWYLNCAIFMAGSPTAPGNRHIAKQIQTILNDQEAKHFNNCCYNKNELYNFITLAIGNKTLLSLIQNLPYLDTLKQNFTELATVMVEDDNAISEKENVPLLQYH